MTENILTTARRMTEAEKARRERGQDNIAATLAVRAARAELRISASETEAAAFQEFATRFPDLPRVSIVLLWDQCPAATRVNTRQSWPFDQTGPRRVRRNAASLWILYTTGGGALRGVQVYDKSATDPA
ncbi:hypothetical protein [Micrococcus luteus]|uniref:hypothetical protein n=1 Tax=Micrococcus luteus TaxID=1270 RepID=UPI0033B5CC8D